jgi:acyl-CoA thioesterase-1
MKQIYKILISTFLVIIFTTIYIFLNKAEKTENKITYPITIQEDKDIKIVAFGDSLTAGYNLPINESYPAQLESRLSDAGFSVNVINSGVSGETTRGNLERAEFIRSQNPDIVLLGIGGNDALRSLSVDNAKNNIEKTIQILQGGDNAPIIFLLQIQSPLNSGFSYKKQFDDIYPSLAKTYKLELIPFLTTEIFLNPVNVLSDGIHLNKQGYGKVVDEHVFPAIIKKLSL